MVAVAKRTADVDDGLFEPFKVIRKGGLVVVQDLPLVDEHTVFDEEGEFVCECDTKMLQWIASNNNKRVRETGDEVPVTIGHTIDDAPEHKQPIVVGYSRDFYVAPLVNPQTGESTGRNCIYARKTTFTEEDVIKHDLKRYGRRSVEIWFDKAPVIDPIALLSSTTPERDLGILRLSRKGKKLRCGEMGMIGCQIPKPVKPVRRQRFGNVTNYPSDQDDLVARILAELMASEPMKFLEDLQNDPGMMEAYLATHMPQPNMDMVPDDPGAGGMSDMGGMEDLDQNQVPDMLDEVNGPLAPERNQRRPARYQADEGEGDGEFADDMGSTLNGGGDMSVQMSRNGNTHAPRVQNSAKPPLRNSRLVRLDESGQATEGLDAQTHGGGGNGSLTRIGDDGQPISGRPARYAKDAPHGEMPIGDESDELEGEELDMLADEFASEDDLPGMVDEAELQEEEMEAEVGGDIAEEVADAAVEDEGGHHCPHCGGHLGAVEEEIEDESAAATEMQGAAHDEAGAAEDLEDAEMMRDEEQDEEYEEEESPIRNAAQPHEVGGNPEHPRGSMFRTPGGRLPQQPTHEAVRPHNVGGRTPASQTVSMEPMEAAYANSGRRPGEPSHYPEHEPRRHAREGEPVQRKKLALPDSIHSGAARTSQEHMLPKKPVKRSMTMAGSTGQQMTKGAIPKRNAMGSTASGTNGFTPSASTGKKNPQHLQSANEYQNPSRLQNPQEVEHLSRRKVKRMRTATVNTAPQMDLSAEDVAALRDRLDQLENENHTLRTEVGSLRQGQAVLVKNARGRAMRERLQRRRSELLMAENEGVELDISEEMGDPGEGDAYTMNEGQWQRKIAGIRKRYSRSIATRSVPIHPALMSSPESRQGGVQGPVMNSKDDVWAAVKAAQAAGNSVEEQKAAYRKLASGVA